MPNRDEMRRHRDGVRAGVAALGVAFALLLARMDAAPPIVEFFVSATSDADTDRILVRWQPVGNSPYTHYDVLRRGVASSAFTQINPAPIGPMVSVAFIQALATAPANQDGLLMLQSSYGNDYASDLLSIMATQQEPDRTLLPDQNYVAAVAMGLGFLDETVTATLTYVYEVWGLDAQGFRVERLGQATATARQPVLAREPVDVACVQIDGVQGDRAAFMRFRDNPQAQAFFGYDVFRLPYPPGGPCPADLTTAPSAVIVNEFPVLSDSPGASRGGKMQFQASCASSACHAAPDPRGFGAGTCATCTSPCTTCGVAGGSLDGFRSHQTQGIPGMPIAAHDTTPLLGLSADALEKIFDYVEEFQFEDDADLTPGGPLMTNQIYCYQAVPRDLLGQHGSTQDSVVRCAVQDKKAPAVPILVKVERFVPHAGREDCHVSWKRNTDDTTAYDVCVSNDAIPVNSLPPTVGCSTVPQPGSGDRVQWDAGHSAADAGKTFYYAVRAVDANGNMSGMSGWGPCMPRDIVPPGPPIVTWECCSDAGGGCVDRRGDEEWQMAGGFPGLFVGPGVCPAQVTCSPGPDVFKCRAYRSFDGIDYAPVGDAPPNQPIGIDFKPGMDALIYVQTKAVDASGNTSPPIGDMYLVAEGKAPLPPPKVTSIMLINPLPGSMTIRVRFKSLPPEQLLGFAFYKQYAGESDPTPPEPSPADLTTELVAFWPSATLATGSQTPPQWIVKGVPQKLSAHLPALGSLNPYLVYDIPAKTYETEVTVGKTDDIVLRIAAIGASGKQSKTAAFRWGGWDAGDQVLEWPKFREENASNAPTGSGDFTAMYDEPGIIEMTWTAYPDGCIGGPSRHFIVFRRRGDAPRWHQISVPFTCSQTTSLLYQDQDVEPGFYYTYVVVRLKENGEFDHQYGPRTQCYDGSSSTNTCPGPQPQ